MISLEINDKDTVNVAFSKFSVAINQLSEEIDRVSTFKGLNTSSFLTKKDITEYLDRLDNLNTSCDLIKSEFEKINEKLKSISDLNLEQEKINYDFSKKFETLFQQMMVVNSFILKN